MFSIIIPTFNNKDYLELCIKSIRKNSNYNHQIVPHVNMGEDGTIELLNNLKIDFTYTSYNAGICEGMNKASKNPNQIIFYMHMMTFIFVLIGTYTY